MALLAPRQQRLVRHRLTRYIFEATHPWADAVWDEWTPEQELYRGASSSCMYDFGHEGLLTCAQYSHSGQFQTWKGNVLTIRRCRYGTAFTEITPLYIYKYSKL